MFFFIPCININNGIKQYFINASKTPHHTTWSIILPRTHITLCHAGFRNETIFHINACIMINIPKNKNFMKYMFTQLYSH